MGYRIRRLMTVCQEVGLDFSKQRVFESGKFNISERPRDDMQRVFTIRHGYSDVKMTPLQLIALSSDYKSLKLSILNFGKSILDMKFKGESFRDYLKLDIPGKESMCYCVNALESFSKCVFGNDLRETIRMSMGEKSKSPPGFEIVNCFGSKLLSHRNFQAMTSVSALLNVKIEGMREQNNVTLILEKEGKYTCNTIKCSPIYFAGVVSNYNIICNMIEVFGLRVMVEKDSTGYSIIDLIYINRTDEGIIIADKISTLSGVCLGVF